MRSKKLQNLFAWEERLARFEMEMDFYMEDPLSCCDTVFFEEELASCRMCLRDVRSFCPEERLSCLTSRILHVEKKLDLLKTRERYPWSAGFA